MNDPRGGSTNITAVVALVAGVACFCFWGLGAVLAIGLGLLARSEITRSEPRQGGLGLANAAIGLGTLNLCAWLVAIGAWIAWVARPEASPPLATGPAPRPLVAPSPPLRGNDGPDPSRRNAGANRPPVAQSSRARGIEETWLGRVRLVDIRPAASGSGNRLAASLSEQLEQARGARERVVLFAVAPDCLPCNGVALSLRDARVQTALSGVRLVRVDVADFAVELSEIGVPVQRIPGFARLAEGVLPRAEDFIDGGEWDADIPANIAPVLGAFVRGRYHKRRQALPDISIPGQTLL